MVTTVRKAESGGKIEWIYASLMKVSKDAQRPYRAAHAKGIAADFDLDMLMVPVLSYRDGVYWIVDGQHRIEAARMNDFGDYAFKCLVYYNLSEQEEAHMFRRLNDSKRATPYDDFHIAVFGKDEPELSINKAVERLGLKVTRSSSTVGGVAAISALKVAWRMGEKNFTRSLSTLSEGFYDEPLAFNADMIRGMAMFLERYGAKVRDTHLIKNLQALRGGPRSIMRKAETVNLQTERSKSECVSAQLVTTYNKNCGRGGLESWWK